MLKSPNKTLKHQAQASKSKPWRAQVWRSVSSPPASTQLGRRYLQQKKRVGYWELWCGNVSPTTSSALQNLFHQNNTFRPSPASPFMSSPPSLLPSCYNPHLGNADYYWKTQKWLLLFRLPVSLGHSVAQGHLVIFSIWKNRSFSFSGHFQYLNAISSILFQSVKSAWQLEAAPQTPRDQSACIFGFLSQQKSWICQTQPRTHTSRPSRCCGDRVCSRRQQHGTDGPTAPKYLWESVPAPRLSV